MVAPFFAVIALIKGSLVGLGVVGGFLAGGMNRAQAGADKYGKQAGDALGKGVGKASGYTDLRNQKLNAKAEMAKNKADKKSAELAAGGGGWRAKVMGTSRAVKDMQDSQFNAAQYQDDAAMASVGLYNGDTTTKEGKRLEKISRKNAEELGIYEAGNASYDRDLADAGTDPEELRKVAARAARSSTNATAIAQNPNGYKARKREQAKTAVQQQEAKAAQRHDATYSTMSARQAQEDIMSGGMLKNGVDKIKATSAIKRMAEKGEWGMVQQSYDALAASGQLDRSGMRELGSVLKSAPDSGDQAFQLKALGKQLENDADAGTAPTYSTAGDYFASTDFTSAINSGKYDKGIATMHGESAAMIPDAALVEAGGRVSAKEMDNMTESNFLAIAKAQLQTTYASYPTAIASINSAATIAELNARITNQGRAALQTTFSKAYGTAHADRTAATHWNADIKTILGL